MSKYHQTAESIGLEFICNGTKYGDSTPGSFNINDSDEALEMVTVPCSSWCQFDANQKGIK
jgi:hypothetical protein